MCRGACLFLSLVVFTATASQASDQGSAYQSAGDCGRYGAWLFGGIPHPRRTPDQHPGDAARWLPPERLPTAGLWAVTGLFRGADAGGAAVLDIMR